MNKLKLELKVGSGNLTKFGKLEISKSMYFKGRDFIYAGLLLKKTRDQHGHVYLHLICQGLEIILKSKLLFKDYDKFKGDIKDKLGHDLLRIVDCWKRECNKNRIDKRFYEELKSLNVFYKKHRLRYGNFTDIFFDPKQFRTTVTTRQLLRLIMSTDKMIANLK